MNVLYHVLCVNINLYPEKSQTSLSHILAHTFLFYSYSCYTYTGFLPKRNNLKILRRICKGNFT